MLKKILLSFLLALSVVHASEITVGSFAGLSQDDQRKALIALSTTAVEEFQAIKNSLVNELSTPQDSVSGLTIFLKKHLQQLTSSKDINPTEALLQAYGPGKEKFADFFSKERINTLLMACPDSKSTILFNISYHLALIHKQSNVIAVIPSELDGNKKDLALAAWLSAQINSEKYSMVDKEFVATVRPFLTESDRLIKAARARQLALMVPHAASLVYFRPTNK